MFCLGCRQDRGASKFSEAQLRKSEPLCNTCIKDKASRAKACIERGGGVGGA